MLEKAVGIDTNDWLAQKELAVSLLDMGRTEETYQHVRRARELNPQAPSVQLPFYRICIWRRDYEAALAELDKFLTLHPRDPLASQIGQERDRLRQFLQAANTGAVD